MVGFWMFVLFASIVGAIGYVVFRLMRKGYRQGVAEWEAREPIGGIAIATTGLDPSTDEVLGVAVVGHLGNIVLDERYGAVAHGSWPEAMEHNHIEPLDVIGRATLAQSRRELQRVLDGFASLAAYNTGFVRAFLERDGLRLPEMRDAMEAWRERPGERLRMADAIGRARISASGERSLAENATIALALWDLANGQGADHLVFFRE